MSNSQLEVRGRPPIAASLSPAALAELEAIGLAELEDKGRRSIAGIDPVPGRGRIPKRAVHAPKEINEAYDYAKPSSFSRGLRVELPGATMIFLSGTASVDENGRTVHPGDFKAQCLRTYRNLTRLLAADGASWHDVVRTTCYLRDIERDYEAFNEIRTFFLTRVGLDPLPASTGIQARLCLSDLLVEIEAIAIVPRNGEDRR